jgi:nitroreductase
VDAGRLAATGSNRQPWDFVIVTERDKIVQFKSAGAWIASAAVVIVVVMDPSSRWWVEDGAAAIENMLPACSGALRSLEVKKWNSAMIPSKFPDNEIVNFCLLRLS